MTESTARAERLDVQTAASPFYLWEVAQKPVSVRIPFNLIDRLEHEAVESFRSLTSRGSEIGGLLVGEVTNGNPLVVSIADYELIPCDYSRGPLYRLSDADSGRFEHAIQQRLASGRAVAGFFRSQTRKGLCLDSEDLAFFQARFRDPHHIALLIRPFATKASTAGIFIWENGKVNGESSYHEFPFRSSELGSSQAPETENFKAPAPAAVAPPTPKPASRGQIVPIASRREISLPPVPAAEPAPPATPVAPPPPPAPEAVAPPPAPAPQAAPLAGAEKADKTEKPEKAVKAEKAPIQASDAVVAAPARTEKEEFRAFTLPASLEPEVVAPSSGRGLKLLVAAAASIVLFVALFVYPGFLRSNSKPAPVAARQDTSPLQLRVERANGELLLTWNPDAEAVRNASKAVLSIADGDQHENVAVDAAQLASGRIVYLPSGTDISFKLEVTDKSQKKTTSESVRMLRTRPSPLQEQTDAAAAKAAALAAGNKTAAPAATPASGVNPEEQPVTEQTPKASAPLKPFKAESLSQRLRPAANTDMPDAPTVNAGERPASSAIPGVNVNAVVPPPMAPTPAPVAPAPVAAESQPKSGGQIQQAVLIYKKDAEYPKIAKQTGAKGTVVLSATIGKDGNIKAVRIISGHSMLTKAAADAVKQWRYKPTMLNGQPVEAETQVLVNFVGDR